MSFVVSASEAILLGHVLEHYLQARQDDESVAFLDVIWSQLRPYCPQLGCSRHQKIPPENLPADVEWLTTDSVSCGYSPGSPRAFFIRLDQEPGIGRFGREQVQGLVSLILTALRPHVAANALDEARFGLEWTNSWGRNQQLYWNHNLHGEWPERHGFDDSAAIESTIAGLVTAPINAWSKQFQHGRSVGRGLATCYRYEVYLLGDLCVDRDLHSSRYKPIGPQGFRDSLFGIADILIEHELESVDPYCINLLSTQVNRSRVMRDPEDSDPSWSCELQLLADCRSAFQFTFGELIASYQRDIELRGGTSSRPAVPRSLKLATISKESTSDKVRGTLALCENLLDDDSISVLPEQIVAMLANSVEALARRIWANAFTNGGPKAELSRILGDKQHKGNRLEQRFSSLALTLYKTYRNSSQHNFDAFHCTWSDAMFFMWGVRTLLEITEDFARQ